MIMGIKIRISYDSSQESIITITVTRAMPYHKVLGINWWTDVIGCVGSSEL